MQVLHLGCEICRPQFERHAAAFFRGVFQIVLPPLRERKVDIPLIAEGIIQTPNEKHGTSISGLDSGVMECITNRLKSATFRFFFTQRSRNSLLPGPPNRLGTGRMKKTA